MMTDTQTNNTEEKNMTNQAQIDSQIMNVQGHIQTWTESIERLTGDIVEIQDRYESKGWNLSEDKSTMAVITEKQDRIVVLQGRIEGHKETLRTLEVN